MLKEAIISTSCTAKSSDSLAQSIDGPHPPLIADVALRIHRLRAVLLNTSAGDSVFGTKHGRAQILYFGTALIGPTELERITTLCDLLSDVYSWAIEEGSTFTTEPSILAQEGVPEIVCICLLCQRPRVVTEALRIARHLLRHPTSFAELHRVLDAIYAAQEKEGLESRCGESLHPPVMIRLLDEILQTLSKSADVVAATLGVAAELSLVIGPIPYTADSFICDEFVSNVLRAWEQHEEDLSVVTAAVFFFSALVTLRRGSPQEIPVAILLTHIGCVLKCMIKAMQAHTGNTSIRKAVLKFFAACASYDQNRDCLIKAGAFTAAMTTLTLKTAVHSDFEVLGPAVECVSYCIPLLDSFQCRSLILRIHGLLTHRGEISMIQLTLALLYRLLSTLPPPTIQDRCTLYAQPYSPPLKGKQGILDQNTSSGRYMQLKKSILLDHLPLYEDARKFIHLMCIPQLVAHVIDYYRKEMTMRTLACEGYDSNEDDDEKRLSKSMEQVFALAKRCITLMNL